MTTRIVVGVDGSDGAVGALRWAVDEARLRGPDVTLTLVHSWTYPYVGDVAGMAGYVVSQEQLESDAREVVDHTIAAAGDIPEDVRVDRVIHHGGAANVLLDAAQGADLLVLGSRGRGGFAGLLLGSVSQQCVHHAPCPVVVVPHRP